MHCFADDTLTFLIKGRTAVAWPLRTIDGAFGNLRAPPAEVPLDPTSLGFVGFVLGFPALAFCGALSEASMSAATSPAPNRRWMPCWAVTQVSAAVGVIPKATVSGVLAAAVLPAACLHGAYRAATFQPTIDDHQPGVPCANPLTLVEMTSVASIPPQFFFRTQSNHGFDIRELAQWVRTSRTWSNPYAGMLTLDDRIRFARHPSGMGRATYRWMKRQSQGLEDISGATRRALAQLAGALSDDLEHSGRDVRADATRVAIASFAAYWQQLHADERRSCDRALRSQTGESLGSLLQSVFVGQSCTRSLASHLDRCAQRLAKVAPRYA